MTNSTACRELGIERRTANKWRYGFWITNSAGVRRFIQPVQAVRPRVKPTESGRYLSEDERITIADGVQAGRSLRAIAAELGRSASTVSREVARNRDPVRVVPGLSMTLENEAIATLEIEATPTDWLGDLDEGLGVDPAACRRWGSA